MSVVPRGKEGRGQDRSVAPWAGGNALCPASIAAGFLAVMLHQLCKTSSRGETR